MYNKYELNVELNNIDNFNIICNFHINLLFMISMAKVVKQIFIFDSFM